MPKSFTGETYLSSNFENCLMVAGGKEGKTTFLIASILGLLPNQQAENSGGLVTKPEHLHIFTFDPSALGGMKKFLREVLKAPDEALKFSGVNFQADVDATYKEPKPYQAGLFNSILAETVRVRNSVKAGEVHALIFSSISVMAPAIKREIAGVAGGISNMDMNKWAQVSSRLQEIRSNAAGDWGHLIWEGHIFKMESKSQGQKGQQESQSEETLLIEGKQGQLWGASVERIYRLRRKAGITWPGSKCDKVAMETRPKLDFVAGGRGVTTDLDPEEWDLTKVARKLGLKVGGWGVKSKTTSGGSGPIKK